MSQAYQDALRLLNSTQSGFQTLHNQPLSGPERDRLLMQHTKDWLRRIGYSPSDLNRLNVVHISGTKGKGSTSALTSSILNSYRRNVGLPRKVGLYTSPHLVSVRERICINGEAISEDQFAAAFFYVWKKLELDKAGAQKPPYFRLLTLMSFHLFMTEGVDAAVYEVGIGGENDATNVFEAPAAAGVTSLGIDHVGSLGHTLPEIAWHKAGIFKAGRPAFTVVQETEAMEVLETRAQGQGAVFSKVDVDARLDKVKLVPAEAFQQKNASLAIRLAAECLRNLNVDIDLSGEVLPRHMVAGLESSRFRGRCETLQAKGRSWFLDGAHNDQSLKVACSWLAHVVDKNRPCALIFNQQSTRDARALLGVVHKCLADSGIQLKYAAFCTNNAFKEQTKLDFVNANIDPDVLKALTLQLQLVDAMKEMKPGVETTAVASIEEAVEFVTDKDAQIFVTGSLHLVGGLIAVLEDSWP